MYLHFLRYLVDPFTQESLSVEVEISEGDDIISGFLVSSKNRFPIINGIPRFVPSEAYTSSFGWQWNHWSRVQFDSENCGKPMHGHTAKMWHRITGLSTSVTEEKDEVILDIGSGPGRFIETVRNRNPNALIIAVDYSNAVEATRQNFHLDTNICVIQADALNLPIMSRCIDGAYSIGVLHHTPNPEAGVKEAFRVLKKSAWFAVSVYGKSGYYNFSSVQIWRKIFKFLWPYFGEKPPLIYTYLVVTIFRPVARRFRFLGRLIRVFFPFINLPDRKWSLLDTFDAVTPAYQSAHDSFEVYRWFQLAGFANIEPTNWGYTSFRGTI